MDFTPSMEGSCPAALGLLTCPGVYLTAGGEQGSSGGCSVLLQGDMDYIGHVFSFIGFMLSPGEREMVWWGGRGKWDGDGEKRAGTDGARERGVGS